MKFLHYFFVFFICSWSVVFCSEKVPEKKSEDTAPEAEKHIAPDIAIKSVGKTVDDTKLRTFDKDDDPRKKSSSALLALKNIDICSNSTKIRLKFSTPATDTTQKSPIKAKFLTIAKVNNELITNFDVINAIKFFFFSNGKEFDLMLAKMLVQPILNSLIESKLQQQYAKRCNIRVSNKEIDGRIEDIAKSNGMTIEEMEKYFQSVDMNSEIVKKNLSARMIHQNLFQLIKEQISMPKKEFDEEFSKRKLDIMKPRVRYNEVFLQVLDERKRKEIRKIIETLLELINRGYPIESIAQTFSLSPSQLQHNYSYWITVDNLPIDIKTFVIKLKPGEISEVIETKGGFRIIQVSDKAAPNKCGVLETQYEILTTQMQFQGTLFTQKDYEKANNVISDIMKSLSAKEFEVACKKNNLKITANTITTPTPYEKELIHRAQTTQNHIGILQSMENKDELVILLLKKESQPDAKSPTPKDVMEDVLNKKVSKEFNRNMLLFRKACAIEIDAASLANIF
ncbi:hypothetical protein FACS1894113_1420 [Alphaproteobacteria bacterium]|nr:hypothetical protein FACS1894113_1420 [Alphaproteobacteria bacterium]